MTAADAAFFAAHSDRSHLVRPATRAEVAQLAASLGKKLPPVPPAPLNYTTIAHQISAGRCAKVIVVGTADPAKDRGEEHAHGAWDALAYLDVLCLSLSSGGEGWGHLWAPIWDEAAATVVDSFVEGSGLPPPLVVAKDRAIHLVWATADLGCLLAGREAKVKELVALATVFGLPMAGPVTGTPPFDVRSALAEARK